MAEEIDRDWLQKVVLGATIGAVAGFGAGSMLLKPAKPGVVAVVGTLVGAGLSYALLRPSEKPLTLDEQRDAALADIDAARRRTLGDLEDTGGKGGDYVTSSMRGGADYITSSMRGAADYVTAPGRAAAEWAFGDETPAPSATPATPRPKAGHTSEGIPVRGVVFVGR